MSKIDGGPAFPNTGNVTWGLKPSGGMTLRDWFAGMALIGFAAQPSDEDNPETWEEVLKRIPPAVYEIADAMLEERKC
jgi:hypothetical protein